MKYDLTDIRYGKKTIEKVDLIQRNNKDILIKDTVVIIDNDPYLVGKEAIFCNETDLYELSMNTRKGIYNQEGKVGTLLYNVFKTVQVFDQGNFKRGDAILIKDEELAFRLGKLPSKSVNGFYTPTNGDSEFMKAMENIRTFPINIHTTHHADEDNRTFRDITNLFNNTKYKTNFRSRGVAKMLGGLTFGAEFETSMGSLQASFLGPAGLVPVIDGSLSSRDQFEYATVVYKGAKGLEALKSVCTRLTSQCRVDQTCAMHMHIGTLPKNKEYIIALYQLFYRLQDELFNLVPFYKRHEQSIMGKSKEYSERLIDLGISTNTLYKSSSKQEYQAELSKWYKEIFSFIACGWEPGKARNTKNFKDKKITPWDRQWNCPTRYYALNLVNYFFSSGTVEFRLHGPTVNFHRTLMWLLICVGIVRYADKYTKKILLGEEKIRLSDVINEFNTNFYEEDTPHKLKELYREVTGELHAYIKEVTHNNRINNIQAVHRTNNGRSTIQQEHAKIALEEFKNDHKVFLKELY